MPAAGTTGRHMDRFVGAVCVCLLPRCLMAMKVQGICPDAVFYIRLGKLLEAGQFDLFLADFRFNIYPIILSALHLCGLSWETAGVVWGVAISSCTVLPLYGWIRRAFDLRTAFGAGFLYAVHPGLIRCSIEVIRDSTFWFLLAATVYLLWRAVTELHWRWHIAAGTTIALACLTRVEGLTLFLLLAVWTLWRWWQGAGTAEKGRSGEREKGRMYVSLSPLLPFSPSSFSLSLRLLIGASICAGIYPLTLAAINGHWHRGSITSLVRSQPADLARDWVQAAITGKRETKDIGLPDIAPPPSAGKMAERYATGLFKGFSAIYLLVLGYGVATARSFLRRPEYLALASVAGPILLAVWIHLYWSHDAAPRYFFPLVILAAPLASAGLWGIASTVADFLRARFRQAWFLTGQPCGCFCRWRPSRSCRCSLRSTATILPAQRPWKLVNGFATAMARQHEYSGRTA